MRHSVGLVEVNGGYGLYKSSTEQTI